MCFFVSVVINADFKLGTAILLVFLKESAKIKLVNTIVLIAIMFSVKSLILN